MHACMYVSLVCMYVCMHVCSYVWVYNFCAQFQPYFSFTASNVGFGMWSHDVVGPPDDPEMYVRWVQWAALSAVFRSHDRGMSAGKYCTESLARMY